MRSSDIHQRQYAARGENERQVSVHKRCHIQVAISGMATRAVGSIGNDQTNGRHDRRSNALP